MPAQIPTHPNPIDRLRAIMAQLRNPDGGCPWDLKQDFHSIVACTIEEAYEVADAIDRGDFDELRDELGDLLLQVVFHAQMAREAGHFDFDQVAEAICDKLIRRHPHVFGDATADEADLALAQWEAQKRAERAAKGELDTSALAGITAGLPEWARALKLQKKGASVGFDWPGPEPVIAKLHEELDEVRAELDKGRGHPELEEEIGDLLFVALNLSRKAKVDPGAALRRANLKYEQRFRRMESLAAEQGSDFASLDLDAQSALWDRAKAEGL